MKSSVTFIDKYNYLIRLSDKYGNIDLIVDLKNKINKLEDEFFYIALFARSKRANHFNKFFIPLT